MTTKASNLYQDGGVWYIRYNVNGRKIRRSLRTTSLREAQRLRNEILGTRDAGVDVRARFGLAAAPADAGAPALTFDQVADRFIKHRDISDVREKTASKDTGLINAWLRPAFGHRPMPSITTDDVVAFLAELKRAKGKGRRSRGKPLDVNHRSGIFRLLRRIFTWAIRSKLHHGANPCDLDLELRPRAREKERPALTRAEAEKMLTLLAGGTPADDQVRRIALLCMSTGLRPGEAYGLEWADIDLGARPEIRVQRSFQGPPKNDTARSPIVLDPGTAALLRQWETEATTAAVFPTPDGAAHTYTPLVHRQRIREAARLAGVARWREVTHHVFRHTFGSWEYERTGDAKYVQRIMRHARIEITLRVYVHDRRDDHELAASRPALVTRPALRAV